MAFKPNYRQQRSERDRQARNKQAEKLKKLQDQFDAAQKENADLHELAEKQKAQIADLQARLGENGSPVRPPIHTAPMMPATGAPAPAGT